MTPYLAPTGEALEVLISPERYRCWTALCRRIDALYDMERQWNSGGKKWVHEYKYRRGGKTLCCLYARADCAGFMVILEKDERDKFDAQQADFSPLTRQIYEDATTYHDGKWILFPLDTTELFDDYIRLLAIKRKPNRK